MKTQTLRFLLLIALIFTLLTPSTRAHAATFTVKNLSESGSGSLRQAIIDANLAVGADTIDFSVSGTIPGWSTLPPITDAAGLTIDGTGQTVTISGHHTAGVLYVDVGASLTLNNLTIANGANDSVDTPYGGGILNYGGAVTITNSTFSDNSAYSGGGVFNNFGTVTITNSTFSGNTTTGGQGGGVFSTGTVTITNSTFSGNSVYSGGGFGGAIYNDGTMIISNTIVANSAYGGNCFGTITNGGNNIEDSTTCGWGSTNGSMNNTDPLLGALADNGGPTQTFMLLTGSPAIDGVTSNPPNSAPLTDQRGVARPQGVRYDIGAYESTYQSGPTFVVNALADTDDTVCENAPGNCTLREAINAAITFAGANTITFSVSGTNTLGSTLPTITDAAGLTMDGTGQTVTISGNNAVRVLFTGYSASLTLNNLTIANGNPDDGQGSGIWNNGTLTITNSTFSGNTADIVGGGIYNAGTLTITNSAFSGNSAKWGGGIYNYHNTLTITNSIFSDNSASDNGGGIISDGTVTITNSTFSGNNAGSNGGGVSVNSGTLNIANSTFSGNTAGLFGGGIINGGTLTITNSTLSGNTAPGFGSSGGGGIYNVGTVIIRNTILADNPVGNCSGAIANDGNNIDDGTTCGWGSTNGSMSGTDPLLASPADNGGPTQTFALLAGSPAIDGVMFNAPNSAPSTDQRGVARPKGARYDIGSYEYDLYRIYLPLVIKY